MRWSLRRPAMSRHPATVKVSGNVTGAYVVKADASNSKNAVAIWQNDTVVFQATGTKEAVDRFYQKFPM